MTYPYIVNQSIPVAAVFHATSGTLRATVPPAIYDRNINGLTINGPAGTTFDLYEGTVAPSNRKDGTLRGQSNSADYPQPRRLGRGMSLIGVWTKTGLTAADTASLVVFVEQAS